MIFDGTGPAGASDVAGPSGSVADDVATVSGSVAADPDTAVALPVSAGTASVSSSPHAVASNERPATMPTSALIRMKFLRFDGRSHRFLRV
jgi:hypothetical protein